MHGVQHKEPQIMRHENNRCYRLEYSASGQPEIIDLAENKPANREPGFDYEIILKLRNPYNRDKVILTVLGIEAIGTQAAGYYLAAHLEQLGKELGKKEFGLLIKVNVSSGVHMTQRVHIRSTKSFSE